MFGTMAGGENPGRGRPKKNWAQCLADDLSVFQTTTGSTETPPLLFGVETRCYGRGRLRFILIGEFFFHNFQSLEVIGDM